MDYVDFPYDLLKSILAVYLVISSAEATSNNANLDGIKFGLREGDEKSYQEVMFNARTKGFSELIKRRFVLGSYSLYKVNLDKLFAPAQKARRLIVNKINELFETYDAIYNPAVAEVRNPIAGRKDKSELFNIVENVMAIGNFGGFPSLTFPIGLDNNFPYGANITCRPFDEITLFALSSAIEEETNLKDLTVRKVGL